MVDAFFNVNLTKLNDLQAVPFFLALEQKVRNQ